MKKQYNNENYIKKVARLKTSLKINLIKLFVLVLLGLIIANSLFSIIIKRKDTLETKKLINNIQNFAIIDEENIDFKSNKISNQTDLDKLNNNYTNLSYLKEINNDTVGWIKVDGTEVDYPVVQSNDNNYYLNHSFDKTYNYNGWIFMDYRNDINKLNNNTIIYGHSLKNNHNLMFGSLRKLLDSSNEHYITLKTEIKTYKWKIFSIYVVEEESYYLSVFFTNNDAYQTFLNNISSRSKYKFKEELTFNDKIITLSTCYSETERIVIHAKLV